MNSLSKIKDRFFSHVNKTESCWLWTGAKHSRKGYGYFFFQGKKRSRSHRASWELHFGKIENNLHVLHKCDTPACVNPDHLFLGNNSDNMADMVKKGRSRLCAMEGEKNSMAKLTEEQVLQIRKDKRENAVIAKEYGLHRKTIGRIKLKQHWKHI